MRSARRTARTANVRAVLRHCVPNKKAAPSCGFAYLLRTLWAEQFADANGTARKVLNMYPRPFTVFSVGGLFCIYPSFLRRLCTIPKQKSIPELEAEIAAKERQLAQLQHRQQQLENRRSYYEKGNRRKRTHRLITRGAAIESVEPLAKVLSETEFYAFAEKALTLPEVKSLLMSAVNAHNATEQKGKG